MKKLFLIWAFFTLFFIFYKKSIKFRSSLIATLAAINFLTSTSQAEASQSNAFIEPQRQHRVKDNSNSGLFTKSKYEVNPASDSNGSNSDDNDGIGKFPKRERVEQTEKRLNHMEKTVDSLKNSYKKQKTSKQCELDENIKETKFEVDFDFELYKNGNPTLIFPMKDGSIRRIEFDQTRNKWYHENLFPNISAPDSFDNRAVRNLEYSDKLAYLRKNIPDKDVIKLQNEIGKMLSHPNTISAPGFLGKYKIEGTVDVNMEFGLVSFTDGVTNKHKTIVKMSPERIKKLAKDGFHMFPDK